jgi:hypothetical protein
VHGAYQHWVTRIAKQGELAVPVEPGTQWGTIHGFPVEGRGNEGEEFLDATWIG